MLLVLSVAFAADPTIVARWAAGEVRLQVRPPPGEHVNAEAPLRLVLGGNELRGWMPVSSARLPVPAAGGTLQVEVPFCTDTGNTCRMVTMEGVIDGRRRSGTVELAVPTPAGPAAAGSTGAAVRVYDFGAVWCPPCNQMKAEYLDVAERMAPWGGIEIVAIDVDRPESWPLKSQYRVGGYPTLVAVDAAGTEVDRYVGYEGVAAMDGWFSGLAKVTPLAALRAGPPADVDPQAAGTAALRLARVQDTAGATAWLARAGDTRDAHHARLLLDPERADAEWLIAHDTGSDWVPEVLAAFPDLLPAVAGRIPGLSPGLAAYAFDAYAGHAPAEAALVAHIAFTTLTARAVTDDAEASRGYVVDLADGYASLGDLPRALAVLDRFDALYPGEFTWDHAAARLLTQARRFPEAEVRARAALQVAWGDQRLRAAMQLARALDGQARRADALAVLRTELAAAPTPGPGDAVRTTRYLGEVQAMIKEFGG